MHLQRGFTLIELMIVVAIIGILAAIAVPQYQNYVAKTQVARVMSEGASQKSGIDLCVTDVKLVASAISCAGTASGSSLLVAGGNTMDGAAPTSTKLGVPVLTFTSANGAATLVSTFGNSAAPVISGKNITWTRTSEGVWSCTTTVDAKYTPAGCTKV